MHQTGIKCIQLKGTLQKVNTFRVVTALNNYIKSNIGGVPQRLLYVQPGIAQSMLLYNLTVSLRNMVKIVSV